MDNATKEIYLQILKEELLPAMGCTEPIAVAYAAALARDTLGKQPTRVDIAVSGNILKNVKSVVVPNTGGMKGISAAAAAGIIAGVSDKQLEVISAVTDKDIKKIGAYLQAAEFTVGKSKSQCVFDIRIDVFCESDSASVRIAGHHTNVVMIEKNGEKLLDLHYDDDYKSAGADRSVLSVEKIVEYADTVDLFDVEELLMRQIEYNGAIAREGLTHPYGANVGKVLLAAGDGIHARAKAVAAAGSDARMNGCPLPVVIVSGSGNQGMTASLPVIEYAKHLNKSHEELLRALLVSDLVTIHLKTGIGRLSAYCGAVSAGCGAGAGICYLHGGNVSEISHTIVNALAINSGIICDGAKSSCAAKIASAVEAGLLGFEMARRGNDFCGGDGILGDCVERTIENVGDVARNMRETDEEIIKLMISNL